MPLYDISNAPLEIRGDFISPFRLASADGAITAKSGLVHITKVTAAALTLAAPVAADDGKELVIVSETAAAHVVTSGVDGFNAKGASGTATFGAASGNTLTLVARNGHWWSIGNVGITIA